MRRPWMPFYFGDYLADTGHLSTLEHGAYLLLIAHYWMKGGLPTDDEILTRITRLTAAQWRKAKPALQTFFSDEWKHKRIEFELTESERISAAGRRGGKASGKTRLSSKSLNSHDPLSTTVERPLNDQTNDSRTIREALQPQPQPQPQKATAAGARASGPCDEAWKLASDLAEIAGHSGEPKDWPLGWHGAPQRIQFMLDQKWSPDAIVAGARSCAARAGKGRDIRSVQFFEGAIADEVARQAKPLPTASKTTNGSSYNGPPSSDVALSWQESRDKWRAARADLKANIAATAAPIDNGETGGGQIVRLVAAAGRE